MRNLAAILLATSVVAAAACSDDGGSINQIDARTDAPGGSGVCGTEAGTISSYPGSVTGTTTGQAADLTVAMGACADEVSYDGSDGGDVAVKLTGLTAGMTYVVDLTTMTDLSMYVTTGCDAAGPSSGACLVHVDSTTGAESATFVATGAEAFVIIDAGAAGREGDFTLDVKAAQCSDTNTTACTGATPFCVDFSCVACRSSFDCTVGTAPECSADGACVAPVNMCTEGAGETDNGPAAAHALVSGTPLSGGICSTPSTESDWYKFTATNGQPVTIALTWTTAGKDLDIIVTDTMGRLVGESFWGELREEVKLTYLPAGTYYVVVSQFASSPESASVPYMITATLGAAQTCTTSRDCATEFGKQIYRGACTGGSCNFITTTGGAAMSACDSPADCTSGFCSYRRFESDAEKSVCTTTCTASTECAAGFACTTPFSTNVCWPRCLEDLECGITSPGATPPAGQPWEYLVCATAAGATQGSCGAP